MHSILKAAKGDTKNNGPLNISPELKAIFNRVHSEVQQELKDNPLPVAEISPITGRPKVIRDRPAKYNKSVIKTGMIFGDLIIRGKAATKKGLKPSLRERWRCQCLAPTGPNGSQCGTELVVPKYYLVRKPNPKTHCGCRFQTLSSKNGSEYRIWMMMHQRCENPNHTSYHHYKKAGITICPEWSRRHEDGEGFANFLAHVGPRPSPRHSLDRIRNGEGYYPGNVRWATAEEQRANQGDRIGGLTKEEIEGMGLTVDEYVQKLIDGEI